MHQKKVNLLQNTLRNNEQKEQSYRKKSEAGLRYAQRIQEAFLPSPTHLKSIFGEEGKELTFFFKPLEAVSGDFYWIGKKNHKVVLVVGDCTGHGVPGAFMSVIGSKLLNEIVHFRGITRPDHILSELHKGIRKTLKQDLTQNRDGMDISVCVIDNLPQSYKSDSYRPKINYAGAHQPLLLIQAHQILWIKGDRFAVGGYLSKEEQTFSLHTFSLSKQSEDDTGEEFTWLYLFTDGFQDQVGGEETKKFGKNRLQELLLYLHRLTPENQEKHLDAVWKEWKGTQAQTDDLLIIGLKIPHV